MTTHIHYGYWLFLWYTKCGHHRFVYPTHATYVCERNSKWQGRKNKYFIIVKNRWMILHLMHINTIKSIDAKLYLERFLHFVCLKAFTMSNPKAIESWCIPYAHQYYQTLLIQNHTKNVSYTLSVSTHPQCSIQRQ